MTLEDWKIFHNLTWAEFAAQVDTNPTWARRVCAEGYPCSKELAYRIHKSTGIWPKIGRGRGWSKDLWRQKHLQIMIKAGLNAGDICRAMGYTSRNSARAMISKTKREMSNENRD